jgi:hypothetical protein
VRAATGQRLCICRRLATYLWYALQQSIGCSCITGSRITTEPWYALEAACGRQSKREPEVPVPTHIARLTRQHRGASMSAPTLSATRFSTDIELNEIRPPSPSPQPRSSLASTAKSSTLTLPLPSTSSSTPAASTHALESDPLNSQSLLPVDTGADAWLFLLGATTIEILIWGIPYSIGVLHLYWTNTLFPGYGTSTITLAATMQAGLSYIFTSIFGPCVLCAYAADPGRLISTIGVIASGFVTEVSDPAAIGRDYPAESGACAHDPQPWHLVITFGLLYPFAAATYLPCATILFEWFSARRGLAAGIMYAGTGVGGTIFPFLISGLVGRFGYKPAMVSLGIAYGVLLTVALIPIKRRIPIVRRRGTGDTNIRRPRTNVGFVKHRLVWIGCGITVLSSLGNFIPSLWLPGAQAPLGETCEADAGQFLPMICTCTPAERA